MGEKISSIVLIAIVGVLAFFIASVQAIQISGLDLTCVEESGVNCNVISDITSGECREAKFSSTSGQVKIMSCVKGDYLEVYRQEFPEGVLEACFSEVCVDSLRGFNKKLLTELNLASEEVEAPAVEEPINEVPSEEPITESPNIPTQQNNNFAIDPNLQTSLGISYAQVIDKWNSDTWNDVVDESFSTNSDIAAVRWYNTEGSCTGDKCQDQLHNGNGACNDLSVSDSKFCGVTDEFSNVLLNHAMGSDKEKYDKLHRFSETLRRPDTNNLQCWKYYVTGDKEYNDYNDVCVSEDSASDASIRILGAYGIACAKQKSGEWSQGDINYCGDYEEQGRAIWGYGTSDHGEVKKLSNGDYFLCNGYNNQVNCPAASQSFRPDYYELQFMMDFAVYMDSDELKQGVLDMLDYYYSSAEIGGNMIHVGKTGSQDLESGGEYRCTDLCTPAYMDNIDTWRAIPAISGLYNIYGEMLDSKQRSLFDYWWDNYAKPNGANENKPFEIFSYSKDGRVKSSENSYKTLSMWIPLAAKKDSTYTKESVDKLISIYRADENQFSGAAYYGGYFSQFAQRAIGSSTGMISPSFWMGEEIVDVPVEEPIEEAPNQETPTEEKPVEEPTNPGVGGSSGGSSSGGSTSTPSEPAEKEDVFVSKTYNSIEEIPATCEGGEIIRDEFMGGRRIECINSETGAKLTIEAWDKENPRGERYFEMYKKAHLRKGLEICIAETCISNSGFSRSNAYPIIFGEERVEETIVTEEVIEKEVAPETGLVIVEKDGLEVKYSCKPVGSSNELVVDWNFGDGESIYDVSSTFTHQYGSEGNYYVQCDVWDNSLAEFNSLSSYFEI